MLLLAQIEETDDCWIWTGELATKGTPIIRIDGKRHPARRVMLETIGRPLGQLVWDTCDNPACMNPEHLRSGPRREFQQAMAEKGLFPKGLQRSLLSAQNRNARFGMQQVRAEWLSLAAGETTYEGLSERYGVSLSAVRKTCQRWAPLFICQGVR